MTDRIANLWGKRTPFGPSEDWPVRVDQVLKEGVSEEDVDRWVQTASMLHSNGDALDIAVRKGRIVGVRGRGIDRVNKGRVDSKDLFGWQANNSEDRLKNPLVRKNGKLVEASWDEAMGRVVEHSKRLLEEKGPLAFGFYTTGQLFLEEYYALGVIGKAGLGTRHMDGNTRLCTATAAEALKQTFGTDGQPGSYTDIDHTDAISLYGTNMALMNGLLHEIIANGWYNEEYIAAHTMGFEALKQTVMEYQPQKVAEICGVEAEQIRQAARIIGESERLLSTILQGFYQSHQATAASCQV